MKHIFLVVILFLSLPLSAAEYSNEPYSDKGGKIAVALLAEVVFTNDKAPRYMVATNSFRQRE